MNDKNVLITVAPNGARRGKVDHPVIPLTSEEIADCARGCLEAGAGAMHLHVRDSHGGHTLDAETYRDALKAVRESVGDDLILQVTTEAVGLYTPEQQMAVVDELRPEAVSLALREFLPSEEHEAAFAAFLARMKKWGTSPQFILYTPEEVKWFNDLCRRGVVPWNRPWVLFVLGRYGEIDAAPPALEGYLDHWQGLWGLCAFGRHEQGALVKGALNGGHPRIGFENNMLAQDGSPARDNAAQVLSLVKSLGDAGIGTLSAGQARALLMDR